MVAPPPFRMQTRGRENIKAPVKYDGLVAHDNSEEELYRPTVAQRRSSSYRGKVIEFNPNLPPAAFPTLELGQQRETHAPVVNYTEMRDTTVEQTNRYLPCEMHRSAYPTPDSSTTTFGSHQFRNSATQNPTLDTDFQRLYTTQEMAGSMGVSTLPRSVPITPQSAYQTERKWSNQGWKGWDTSNNFQNPVYAKNVEIMRRLDTRTEEHWNIAEMETSDEEGSCARHITSNNASTQRSPEALGQLWEELPVALQIDLVDIMEDLSPTRTLAMQRLRLNGLQWQKMLVILDKHDEQTAAENGAAASLRSETMRILLSRSGEELKLMTQTGFRQLLQEGLYKSVGEEDYYTITSADLAKAKEYLMCCGQQPELLGHWTNAMGSGANFAALDDGKVYEPDSPARRDLSENQGVAEVLHSTNTSPPIEVSIIKSSISVQPFSQVTMLNNPKFAVNSLTASQHSLPPPQLSRPVISPDPPMPTFYQQHISDLPRASDIQTPLPTPEILVPAPVSDHPSNAQTTDKQPADGGNTEDEEPPPKKRQASTTKRKSVSFAPTPLPPSMTKSNNTAAAPKATTKRMRRKSTTPASAPAPVAPMIPHPPAASPTPQLNSPPPKPTAATTIRRNSMAAPPTPTPATSTNNNNTTTPHQPPAPTHPRPATSAPAPTSQANVPRRRKSTVSIAPPSNITDGRFLNNPVPNAPSPTSKAPTAKAAAAKAGATKKGTTNSRNKAATPAVPKSTRKVQGRFVPKNAAKGGVGGTDGNGDGN